MEITVTKEMVNLLKDRIHETCRTPDNRRVLENMAKPIQAVLEIVETKVKPQAVYRMLPLLTSDEKKVMTSAGAIESRMFASLVNRCKNNRQIIFMIATIGDELEKGLCSKHDILSQWIYDVTGSELMEIVADEVENRIKEIAEQQQLELSLRFSPGYCDWPLKGQQVIFSGLDAKKINVRLTPHKMMIPKKSISCIMMSAESVPVKNQCLLCSKKQCPYRRS
ncbi:MAG: vitamin B12 dependent-methionine synthase activation domain-containing protein [Desulfobacterales bacterium]